MRINNCRKYEGELNMRGISYPIPIKNITRSEKENQNILINVLRYEDEKVFPLRITEEGEQ